MDALIARILHPIIAGSMTNYVRIVSSTECQVGFPSERLAELRGGIRPFRLKGKTGFIQFEIWILYYHVYLIDKSLLFSCEANNVFLTSMLSGSFV